MVDDTGFEFADYDSLLLFSYKYVIFISETIKLRISQSSCFIEDDPLKGQNKGQTQAWEQTLLMPGMAAMMPRFSGFSSNSLYRIIPYYTLEYLGIIGYNSAYNSIAGEVRYETR